MAHRNGWQIVAELSDSGISGSKGRDQRPAFDQLLKRATRREFDLIMVWAIDRLGRSIQHLVGFMNDILAMDVDLYVHQQAIDTTTPSGRMIFVGRPRTSYSYDVVCPMALVEVATSPRAE